MADVQNSRLRGKDKQSVPDLSGTGKKSGRVFGYVIDDALLATAKVNANRKVKLPQGVSLAVVSQKRFPASSLEGILKLKLRPVMLRTERENGATADIGADAYKPDARARALLRGVKQVEQDLKSSGGAFALEQVEELMRNISRQAVNNRVRTGSLLAVPGPSNRATYPVVQFMPDGRRVGGLKEVREALGTESSWMVFNFLVNPEPKLGGRKPIELLKAGRIDEVIEAARRVAVQGA